MGVKPLTLTIFFLKTVLSVFNDHSFSTVACEHFNQFEIYPVIEIFISPCGRGKITPDKKWEVENKIAQAYDYVLKSIRTTYGFNFKLEHTWMTHAWAYNVDPTLFDNF